MHGYKRSRLMTYGRNEPHHFGSSHSVPLAEPSLSHDALQNASIEVASDLCLRFTPDGAVAVLRQALMIVDKFRDDQDSGFADHRQGPAVAQQQQQLLLIQMQQQQLQQQQRAQQELLLLQQQQQLRQQQMLQQLMLPQPQPGIPQQEQLVPGVLFRDPGPPAKPLRPEAHSFTAEDLRQAIACLKPAPVLELIKDPCDYLHDYGDPSIERDKREILHAGPIQAGVNGNWRCARCDNVNFPRRRSCKKCNEARGAEATKIVWEYVRQVMQDRDAQRKDPSSYLVKFGDPLAAQGARKQIVEGVDGNWKCVGCWNLNFPRRSRCNKCNAHRPAEADAAVADYTLRVLQEHLRHTEGHGPAIRGGGKHEGR